MEPISRRNALRLTAGAVGTSGSLGAAVLSGPGLLSVGSAAASKKIHAELERTTYRRGQRMVLQVWLHHVGPDFRIHVTDSTGVAWKRVPDTRNPRLWVAKAGRSGTGTVVARIVRRDGRPVHDPLYHDRTRYTVHGINAGGPLIGMSAQASAWPRRLHEVGHGVAARRIYADLAAGAGSQLRLVEEAHAAGMLPVISYKVGGDVAGAARGRYNAAARAAAKRLASYRLPTAVSFWHEPYGDMSGAQYAAASRQLLPIFKRGKLRVGPLLNGWLLDHQVHTFASYCPDDLFQLWDWVGIDTYESGTASSPGSAKPAPRIHALARFLKARGHGHMPLGVGEYNGWSATSIRHVGEALLTTPHVWFGCVWNTTGGTGRVLTGDRLAAFRQTLADPRSAEPRTPPR
jgi:hypothetical protein